MSIASSDVNTYNSDGRIIQVEYAMKAMNRGTTTLGVRLENSVILVSEKKITSPLQIKENITSHYRIYDTILAAVSGINGDAPTIIKKCRNICINHEKDYKEQMEIPKLMEDICDLALRFGEEKSYNKIYSRPFGVSILVAGYQNGPILYNIDPSGSYLEYKAKAIGSAYEVAETILENEIQNLNTEENAIKGLLNILKGVMKDAISEHNVEISIVNKQGIKTLKPEEIKSFIF